jgi:hypothetical protein
VIAGATPIGRPNLTQVTPARAVTPAPVSPATQDQPPPPPANAIAASFVALAPAAMGALIEAQAQASGDSSVLAKDHTQRKIEELIVRLDGEPPPPPPDGTSFTLVRLEAARAALG